MSSEHDPDKTDEDRSGPLITPVMRDAEADATDRRGVRNRPG